MKYVFGYLGLFIAVTIVYANPTPGPFGTDIAISVMQTVEFTYHAEFPIGEESKSSAILYGGPTAVYVWLPPDERGEGLGLEAGVELRGYKVNRYSGIFVGAYTGGGILWRRGEENIKAFSGGVKIGWRQDMHKLGFPADLEPYLCVGFMIEHEDTNGWIFEPAPVIYLGLKLAFF
jgi:hypothetical protein